MIRFSSQQCPSQDHRPLQVPASRRVHGPRSTGPSLQYRGAPNSSRAGSPQISADRIINTSGDVADSSVFRRTSVTFASFIIAVSKGTHFQTEFKSSFTSITATTIDMSFRINMVGNGMGPYPAFAWTGFIGFSDTGKLTTFQDTCGTALGSVCTFHFAQILFSLGWILQNTDWITSGLQFADRRPTG